MMGKRWFHWTILLIAASLVACQPAMMQPQASTATPALLASPTLSFSPTPAPTLTLPPSPVSTPTPSPTTLPAATPTPVVSTAETALPTSVVSPLLTLPYTATGDQATGRIRGRLFFPSEYIPPLAVYAVATDGSRFYRVDTQQVPPGEPSYEIPLVEPGTYYVYGYPAGREAPFGGTYSYLAACEAGHIPPPPEGCWENPQHDLAPVEVRAGQAVEEINVFDWYGPSPPPPPDDTSGWPTYIHEQLSYRIRYPPHWEVRDEREGETTFGPPHPQGKGLASVRVTNGDPEELADALIRSLPPGDVVSREWQPFAGQNSLYLLLGLPEGRFAWWFVPRYELVYIVHATTDSGRGSFDQMVQTFTFVDGAR